MQTPTRGCATWSNPRVRLFDGLGQDGAPPIQCRSLARKRCPPDQLPDASVDAVVVDPPYGGNVMYAELSDFFYVWLKRSVGDLYPGWFDSELVDKDAEAVANPARFEGAKAGQAKEMATRDYLLKMRRVFREMRRVVKPTGSMTVMFTHRETEMWNALGLALTRDRVGDRLVLAGAHRVRAQPAHSETKRRSQHDLPVLPSSRLDPGCLVLDPGPAGRGAADGSAEGSGVPAVGHRGSGPVPVDLRPGAGRAVAPLADRQRGGGP